MREPDSPPVILVAHEEEAVSHLVTCFLRHIGYTVLSATSGEQALALVRRRLPPIDLVLSDAGHRGIGGMDAAVFATAVLAECPGPRLVLVRDADSRAVAPRDLFALRIPLLQKPLDLDLLQEVIRNLLPTLPPAASYHPPAEPRRRRPSVIS
jgi:DNA-binding response OmpR family regulator